MSELKRREMSVFGGKADRLLAADGMIAAMRGKGLRLEKNLVNTERKGV